MTATTNPPSLPYPPMEKRTKIRLLEKKYRYVPSSLDLSFKAIGRRMASHPRHHQDPLPLIVS
jgi:hypothetical protein